MIVASSSKKFTGMDRSKYKNPDMPVGYIKKEQELKYKEGVEIDGEHLVWASWIYDLHLHERDDYATLGDLILTDDEDNVEETEATCTKSPANVEQEAEENVAKKINSGSEKENVAEESVPKKKNSEPEKKETPAEKSVAKRKNSEHEKKENPAEKIIKTEKIDHADVDSSLDTSHSCMDTDSEKKGKRKKEKKIKKERRSDHSASSSPPPRRHRHKKSVVTYSSSPSPERYVEVQIKEEFISSEQPQHLFGSYYCDVCNITMNSLLTYETHVNGKRHRKNMKARNVSEVAAQSIPATVISEDQSKYPQPRPGVIRRKVHHSSKIQHIIEREVKVPCPGLDQIIEIQGIEGVQYFCSMCNSNCSSNSIIPHITGYKHQLRSVKYFKPGAYDYMSNEPKFKIEKELISLLRAVQKKEGMGRMAVEVEELSSSSQDKSSGSQSSSSKDHRSLPSSSKGTSVEHSAKSISERHRTAVIPSQNASDFFCEICQSHMNALAMWEAHIRGKRHLTNLKKMPGDLPSKTKTILLPNKRAFILDRLRDECPDEPVVGLNEVRETEIPETKSHSYQCFLCGSCHTSLDIVEHLISMKHRTKYLEHIDYPGREVYFGMSDLAAESLIREMCQRVEHEEGPGKPAVHISKSAIYR